MIAELQNAPDRFERSLEAIHVLIVARGVGRHALFGEVNEGTIFPDGTESMSGHAIDEQGRIYAFWTDWDDDRCEPVFAIWREVMPEAHWLADGE
jgi:hypothetical protein